MDNKKRIVNLEYFREMLHICPRLPGQTFDELPFEEEILAFLRFLGHNREIRKLNDGMYHKKNVDFSYLLWEDFIYQVEHKGAKKSNEMYYPRDDQMFTTIKLVSRHHNTQQFDVMLPVKLTNEDIRNSKAYKEYYAIASGSAPPKTKASVRRTKSSSDTTVTPPTTTDEGTGIIPGVLDVTTDESDEEISWKSSDEDDDDEVDERSDDQEEDDDQDDDDDLDDDDQNEGNDDDQDTDNDGDDFVHPKLSIHEEEAKYEESFDPIVQTPENSDDEGNDVASLGLNVGGIDSLFETTPRVDVQASTTVAPLTLTTPTLPPPTIPTISQVPQAPTPSTIAPSTFLQDLPNFGSLFGFDHRLKTLEANFSKFVQTNQFAGAVSSIPVIVERYMDQRMNEAVKIILDIYGDTVTLKRRHGDADKDEESSAGSDRESKSAPKEKATKTTGKSTQGSKSHHKTASESAPVEELMQTTQDLEEPSHQEEFETGAADGQPIAEASQHPEWFQQQKKPPTPNRALNKTLPTTHGSIQLWISDLAKQADSRSSFNELMDTPVDFLSFLMNRLKVDTLSNELLAEVVVLSVLITSSTMTSSIYVVVPPVGRKRQQFYGFAVNRESARDVYSKRKIIAVIELEIVEWHDYKHLDWITLTNLTVEERFAFNVSLRMFTRSIVIQRRVEDLQLGSCKSFVELEFFLEEVYKATTDQLDWNNPEGQQYPHNLLKPLPLVPNFRCRRVIPFDHFINNDLEYLGGGASSHKYTTSITKTKAVDYGHIKWIERLAQCGVKNWSAMTNMHSRESLIGDAKVNSSTNFQSTGSMLEMSSQNVESSLSSNFRLSNGIITSIWIGSRCVEMITSYTSSKKATSRGSAFKRLKICVKSYQKKLNLTNPDTYRSDLKCKEAYTTYSNPKGFIYLNKDKHNRLMRIDELHKFSDRMLNDVRTALDDHLNAKDEEDHAKSREVCSWEIVRGRLQDATTDHMIYHMMSLLYKEPKGSTQGYPLVSVEVLRYDKRNKSKNIGIVPTEMELILEHTQQGIIHEVLVSAEGVEERKRNVKIKGVKKEALLTH
nr:hypothetical protein [Tanacetum cinerariifolium]